MAQNVDGWIRTTTTRRMKPLHYRYATPTYLKWDDLHVIAVVTIIKSKSHIFSISITLLTHPRHEQGNTMSSCWAFSHWRHFLRAAFNHSWLTGISNSCHPPISFFMLIVNMLILLQRPCQTPIAFKRRFVTWIKLNRMKFKLDSVFTEAPQRLVLAF